jgi:hypothetical protein
MKSVILLLAVSVTFFSSCTTAYKSGQTPDDVYFSPARPETDENRYDEDERSSVQNTEEYYEDRYLRMKVRNRYRWNELDEWYYSGSRYNYNYYNSCACICTNPWTPYSYWNNYYNPYNHNYLVINPKTSTTYNKPRTFNLRSYNENLLTNSGTNIKGSSPGNNTYTAPRRTTNTNSKSDDTGNFLRNIFKNTESSGSSNTNSSGNSSNNNSSSSGSTPSKSTSAPVRRF